MNVRDIMTRNPITIEPDAAVGTAIDLMVERRIRHLPVVDQAGTVVGVITDRDLRSAALAPALEEYLSESARRRLREIGTTLEALRVRDAMTPRPITTSPEVTARQAAAIMLEHRIGSLPVVENGRLVGVLTDRDAVKAVALQMPTMKRVPDFLW